MSLARELSLGKGKRRPRANAGNRADIAALRLLVAAPRPDLDTFAAVIERVAQSGALADFADGATYNAAKARYTELTG